MNRLKILLLALCLWPLLAFGAERPAQSVVIHVEGMTCSLCVTAINRALRSLPEVAKAKTSLKDNEAVVVVPEGYPLETLLAEIEKTGYRGTIRSVTPVHASAGGKPS